MRMDRCFAVFSGVLLLLCGPAAARDIYVDNLAGDDTYTGRHPRGTTARDGPVRSISKALRLAERGDRIVMSNTGQPYRESISLVGGRHSGFSFKPFVIEGNGAILDGSAPVPAEAWEHYDRAVFRFRPPRLTYQQLFLGDQPAERVAVARPSDEPPALEPLQWCLHQRHIYFCVEPLKLPEDYPLAYAHRQTGITLLHVEHVVMRNLTVQGFHLDGINAHNSAREVTIRGVTCRHNGRVGIAVGGASLVGLEGCQLEGNSYAQLLTMPYSETHARGCQWSSVTAPAVIRQGGRLYIDREPAGRSETERGPTGQDRD